MFCDTLVTLSHQGRRRGIVDRSN